MPAAMTAAASTTVGTTRNRTATTADPTATTAGRMAMATTADPMATTADRTAMATTADPTATGTKDARRYWHASSAVDSAVTREVGGRTGAAPHDDSILGFLWGSRRCGGALKGRVIQSEKPPMAAVNSAGHPRIDALGSVRRNPRLAEPTALARMSGSHLAAGLNDETRRHGTALPRHPLSVRLRFRQVSDHSGR